MPICENESDYIHQKDIGCISRRYLSLNRTEGRTKRDPTDYISSAIRWTDRDACTNNTAVHRWKRDGTPAPDPVLEPRGDAFVSDQWLLRQSRRKLPSLRIQVGSFEGIHPIRTYSASVCWAHLRGRTYPPPGLCAQHGVNLGGESPLRTRQREPLAKTKGVLREEESEGRWRQSPEPTIRNRRVGAWMRTRLQPKSKSNSCTGIHV